MLYIDVPFAEKDAAKASGARWNPEKKKWYVQSKQDYPKFQNWILKQEEDECIVLCDHFYLAVGTRTCFKCHRATPVVGYGVENFYTFYQKGVYDGDPEPEYYHDEIHIASRLEPLPEKFFDYLKQNYNYYYGYSRFTDSSYYGNHCKSCGVLQGNFFVFEEEDSPFFITGADAAKALELYRVPLQEDMKVVCDVGYGSEDDMIKKYAKIMELPFDIWT